MLLSLADVSPALSNSIIAPVDWVIVVIYLIGCVIAGLWMKRYVSGVEDFAVAGREMDLNLGVASLAATEVGIVTVMYVAQAGFNGGFAGAIPGILTASAMFIVGMTGFVINPLRTAGVITIPELLEKQYGKRVRWLAGLVIVLGGVLNMGIFLRLGGEFLIYVTGYNPETIPQFSIGVLHFSALELTMILLLMVVLLYTALGGMVSVLVTDYLQFLIMGAGIVIVSVLVLWDTGWINLIDTLWEGHLPENATAKFGKKMAEKITNPFNPFVIGGIGVTWVIWQSIHALSVVTTWQTTISRVLAAKDVATAKGVYRRTAFYWVGRWCLPGLWGACAFVYFYNQGGLPEGMKSLHAMPAYLHQVLPTGLMGIVLAAMLAAEMSTDSGYLLTWATVIYNDLIMPVKRVPFRPKTRLLVVRSLVVVIGIFLVFYGLLYNLGGTSAWDYLSLTGDIYLSSMFALLVCGLYWRGANSWGAYTAILLGAASPITCLVVNAVSHKYMWEFRISETATGLAAFILAFAGMIVGSLIGTLSGRACRGER